MNTRKFTANVSHYGQSVVRTRKRSNRLFSKPSRIHHVVRGMQNLYKPDGNGNLLFVPQVENIGKYVNARRLASPMFRRANGLEVVC